MKKSLVKPLTEFGITIKTKLMRIGKTQEWLINELKNETGLYIDSSLMYKVLIGSNNNPKLITAIESILDVKRGE